MKKSILIGLLGVGTAVVSYGQGQINFGNYYISTQTTGVTYANVVQAGAAATLGVGPEISATLLWGASTDTAISQLTAIGSSTIAFGLGVATVPGAFGTGAGWFDGGTLLINGGTPGTFAFAIQASGSYNGYSCIGDSAIVTAATQANPLAIVPNLPNSIHEGSFVINPVPEPTTIALAGLGGLALLMLRRKQC